MGSRTIRPWATSRSASPTVLLCLISSGCARSDMHHPVIAVTLVFDNECLLQSCGGDFYCGTTGSGCLSSWRFSRLQVLRPSAALVWKWTAWTRCCYSTKECYTRTRPRFSVFFINSAGRGALCGSLGFLYRYAMRAIASWRDIGTGFWGAPASLLRSISPRQSAIHRPRMTALA